MKRLILIGVAAVLTAVLAFSQTSRAHDLKLLPERVHRGYYL